VTLFRRFGRPGLLRKLSPESLVICSAAIGSRAARNSDVAGTAEDHGESLGRSIPEQLMMLTRIRQLGEISIDEFERAKRRVLEAPRPHP
jgi:hypothetical protein